MGDEPIITTPTMSLYAPDEGEPLQVRNREMGNVLTRAIDEGKEVVPNNPAPLVCKPQQLESWRVFKIMAEFVDGFDLLKKYGLAVTFFGSVRTQPDHHYYQEAVDLAAKLAKEGYAVITGGSAGIMEAGNKGAHDAGGSSIGLNIRLQDNQASNEFLTDSLTFDHFFVRKVMLAFGSEAYVYFPGGFGTLDEFTEILTLVQTKKIKPVPIVLYGKGFWDPVIELFRAHLLDGYATISKEDLSLFQVVDTVDEAFEYIKKNVTAC